MNDAQIGLLVATPIIIIFAIALNKMGALKKGGAVTAVAMAVGIAAVLMLDK